MPVLHPVHQHAPPRAVMRFLLGEPQQAASPNERAYGAAPYV